MKTDHILVLLSGIELLAATGAFFVAAFSDTLASTYRLWEIFPVFLSAFIVTAGLREMKRKT